MCCVRETVQMCGCCFGEWSCGVATFRVPYTDSHGRKGKEKKEDESRRQSKVLVFDS